MSLHSCQRPQGILRRHRGAQGYFVPGGGRRNRHAHRRNVDGEIHHAAYYRGACTAVCGGIEYMGLYTRYGHAKIVERGIVMGSEGDVYSPTLTVLENLRIGAYLRNDEDGIHKDYRTMSYSLFPRLKERALADGGHALRRRTADACCWPRADGKAKLIMMDEPSLGLAAVGGQSIFEI